MYLFFWILIFFSHLLLNAHIDLEEVISNCVIETKRIEIPGYPIAFNPSIIRFNNAILLSFRDIPNRKSNFDSNLGLVWLDEQFNPIGRPQLLDTRGDDPLIHSRAEDGRLVAIGDQLYFIYSNNVDKKITRGGFRLFISKLQHDGTKFSLTDKESMTQFEGVNQNVREKNWVPFDYKNQLLLAYSLSPHLIFKPRLDGSGICDTISNTDRNISWNWGVLRGGTPALLNNGEYLAFFHSSKQLATTHSSGDEVLHYFIGAYTFSAEPPFAITRISPQPIVGKNFYHGPIYKPYWHPVRVVFPVGFLLDGDYIWLAYGRQDHEVWVAKLDKRKLLDSLIPVE